MKTNKFIYCVLLFLVFIVCFCACSKGEFINQESVAKMYVDNKDLFECVAQKCINIKNVGFGYDNNQIVIGESYGDKESFELDEELEKKLLVCFRLMGNAVSDEYDENDYNLSIGYSESFDNIVSVDFTIYDSVNKEYYVLSYSKNDLSDFPLAIKFSDNWYYWWWGQV